MKTQMWLGVVALVFCLGFGSGMLFFPGKYDPHEEIVFVVVVQWSPDLMTSCYAEHDGYDNPPYSSYSYRTLEEAKRAKVVILDTASNHWKQVFIRQY